MFHALAWLYVVRAFFLSLGQFVPKWAVPAADLRPRHSDRLSTRDLNGGKYDNNQFTGLLPVVHPG